MDRKDSATDTTDYLRKRRTRDMDEANDGLNIRVLGVYARGGLHQLSCALLQYRQDGRDNLLRVQMVQHDDIVLPPAKRLPLITALRDAELRTVSIPHFNILLGLIFSEGIKKFCTEHEISLTSIDLISTHSLAALTRPRNVSAEVSIDDAFGWSTVVATETGISTMFDYTITENAIARPQISHTAFVEKLLLRHPTKFRACLNMSELATLNFIPPSSDNNSRGTLARTCGPGSLLIDYAVRYCTSNVRSEDHDGKHAESGQINQTIVERFLASHNYSRMQPPLVIAREMFGNHEAQQLVDECLFLDLSEADTIATVTRATAHSILLQFHRLLALFFPQGQKVDELFICGPSARNSNIIDYLEATLPDSLITKPLEDIGVPSQANEAISFAHLGFEAVLNQATRSAPPPPRAPSPTSIDIVQGRVIPGQRWESLLEKVLRFSGGTQLYVTPDVRFTSKPSLPNGLSSQRPLKTE